MSGARQRAWNTAPCTGLAFARPERFGAAAVAADDRTIAIDFLGTPDAGCGDVEHVDVKPLADSVVVTLYLSYWWVHQTPSPGTINACSTVGLTRTTWAVSPERIRGRPLVDGASRAGMHIMPINPTG